MSSRKPDIVHVAENIGKMCEEIRTNLKDTLMMTYGVPEKVARIINKIGTISEQNNATKAEMDEIEEDLATLVGWITISYPKDLPEDLPLEIKNMRSKIMMYVNILKGWTY